MTEQVSSMEHDRFHVPYLSDKILEVVFHGQAVKTVAYLRISTAQQDLRSQRLAILRVRKHDFRIDDEYEWDRTLILRTNHPASVLLCVRPGPCPHKSRQWFTPPIRV